MNSHTIHFTCRRLGKWVKKKMHKITEQWFFSVYQELLEPSFFLFSIFFS